MKEPELRRLGMMTRRLKRARQLCMARATAQLKPSIDCFEPVREALGSSAGIDLRLVIGFLDEVYQASQRKTSDIARCAC